jgi:1-acyl-sn-glycerol-3-phosphate acyltransferase
MEKHAPEVPSAMPSNPEGTRFYALLKKVGVPILKLYFRVRAEGLHNLPSRGSFILAANHSSYLDPVVLGATCPRAIHFIMLRKYWDKPLLGWICKMAGSFPVDQERPAIAALRQALIVLRRGQVLGIFPEGGISPDGKLQPGKDGAALLALKTRLPLIPAAILGTHRALPRGKLFPRPVSVLVRYGRPVVFPNQMDPKEAKGNLAKATESITEAIRNISQL